MMYNIVPVRAHAIVLLNVFHIFINLNHICKFCVNNNFLQIIVYAKFTDIIQI